MPKMVEVDEVELQQNVQLREFVGKMRKNPKAWLLVEQAAKMTDPNAVTTEFDRHQAIMEPVEELRKELAAEKKAREDEKAEREKTEKLRSLDRNIEEGIDKIRREQRLTEDGEKKLRATMEERGILDPEVAWAYVEKMNPPPEPVRPGGQGAWNFMELPEAGGDADIDKLLKTSTKDNVNERVIDKMARDALLEFRGQSRR